MSEPLLTYEQLTLDLFPSLSFGEILAQNSGSILSISTSNRLKRSWYVKMNPHSGERKLFVPKWMETAPTHIKQTVVEWALLIRSTRFHNRKNPRKKELERTVLRYMTEHNMTTRNRSHTDPAQFVTLGRVYDLTEIFNYVNFRYFKNELRSAVRWGKHPLRSFQTHKIDISGNRYNLITIATMYNKPDVPRYAIEAIMHHEMLHIAIPPTKRGARNIIHGRDFKEREQSFPAHTLWREWEKTICKRR